MSRARTSVVLPLAGAAALACYFAEVSAGWSEPRAAIDAAVGFMLCVAGCLDQRQPRGVLLVVAGFAWLLGGVVPELANLHRGVVALALMSPPTSPTVNRTKEWVPWALPIIVAVPLTLNQWGPWPAALLFAIGALLSRHGRAAMGACAALEALVGIAAQVAPATLPPVGYSLGIVTIVLLSVFSHRHVLQAVGTETARASAAGEHDVHALLTDVLRATLRDPSLVVSPTTEGGSGRDVAVRGRPWARVASDAHWTTDEATWLAVRESIALVGEQRLLIQDERAHADELNRSRGRLLDAADTERARIGVKVAREVIAPLRSTGALADASPGARELAEAAADAEKLLGGIAPVPLGGGAIAGALARLVERWPSSVELSVELSAPTDAVAEAVVYAICAEGLSNQAKHQPRSRSSVRVWTEGDVLRVIVADDGAGGADPMGSGLRGLRDRVDTRGGHFEVVSPPAGGTELHASVPRIQPTGT